MRICPSYFYPSFFAGLYFAFAQFAGSPEERKYFTRTDPSVDRSIELKQNLERYYEMVNEIKGRKTQFTSRCLYREKKNGKKYTKY